MRFKKNYQVLMVYPMTFVLVLVLSACAPSATPVPTEDVSQIQTQSAQTVVADMTQNAPAATEAAPPTEELPPTAAPEQAEPPGPTPDPNIPVAVVPTPAPGEPSAVANYNTAVFGGPGENYVVYGAFLGSQTALVTGKSEDGLWWAISVPVGLNGNGWVSADWVTVTNADNVAVIPAPPAPPTVDLVPPGPDDPQAVTIANVNVRTGPTTDFPIYGIAPVGASARVLGVSEDGQWWVVRLNPENVGAGYGWVSAEYTQPTNVEGIQIIATPPAPVPVPPPAPPQGVPFAVAVDAINVRSGPGTNYPVYVVAPMGSSAEVSGKSADSGWWQVKIQPVYSPTGLAWVSADYVYTENTENVPVVEAPPPPPTVEETPPAITVTGCQLIAQDPADGTIFAPGAGFATTWELKNTGTVNWDQQEYDVDFVGAVNNVALHAGADRNDLTSTVEPGGTYNFTMPMIAPFDPGVYGELWQVVYGSQPVCQFYVYIEVQ